MTDAVAIIPARGGSKRLPRKNILPLHGRPLLAYTIDAARQSGCFDTVIVSTEDGEIAALAEAHGAELMRRQAHLANDTATVVEVCCDALDQLSREGRRPNRFACLLATAALRTAEDIRLSAAMLSSGRCEFVMAVTDYEKSPLQALVAEADDSLRLMWPELANTPRTRAPRMLVDNGSTYWCGTDAFLAARTFYGPALRGYWMPRERSIDVDTAEDWSLLEYFMSRSHA